MREKAMPISSDNKHSSHSIKEAGEEIEELGKECYHKIVSWIKAHPFLTLLFSFLLSVASNLLSQWLWNLFT